MIACHLWRHRRLGHEGAGTEDAKHFPVARAGMPVHRRHGADHQRWWRGCCTAPQLRRPLHDYFHAYRGARKRSFSSKTRACDVTAADAGRGRRVQPADRNRSAGALIHRRLSRHAELGKRRRRCSESLDRLHAHAEEVMAWARRADRHLARPTDIGGRGVIDEARSTISFEADGQGRLARRLQPIGWTTSGETIASLSPARARWRRSSRSWIGAETTRRHPQRDFTRRRRGHDGGHCRRHRRGLLRRRAGAHPRSSPRAARTDRCGRLRTRSWPASGPDAALRLTGDARPAFSVTKSGPLMKNEPRTDDAGSEGGI